MCTLPLLCVGELAGQPALPEARALVERHIELMGGEEHLRGLGYRRIRGTFELPALEIQGELEVHQAAGRSSVVVNLPGLGPILSGFDGEVSWSLDPIQGPRVAEGAELAQAEVEASVDYLLRAPSLVAALETAEPTEMNGQPCWRVRILWRSGIESDDCYAMEGGLLVASARTQPSPMGDVQVINLYSDYRDFGGYRTATRITQQLMGQEQVMVITSVEFPLPDPRAFALPPEIEALLGE